MKNSFILPIIILPTILSGCLFKTTSHTDVEKYEEYLAEAINNSDFHSQLTIFPTSVKNAIVEKFEYKSREDLFTGSYFFYLVVTYNEIDFNLELARLETVHGYFPEQKITKPILKYPEQSCYITIDKNSRYEYVCYDKETFEIAYVSNQLFTWDDIEVSNRHLIPEVEIPKELDDGDNSYNMYYYYEGDIGWYVG